MRTSRLEAFSDAVLAIILTVMVLGLDIPTQHDLRTFLHDTGHGLITYLLSFLYIGIYWTNHHHMFHLVQRVSGGVLWANLALLFTLSLLPFTTEWITDARLARTPLFVYGLNLMLSAAAYFVLQTLVIRQGGADSPLARAVGRDVKGKVSPVLYLAGMLCTVLVDPHGHLGSWLALACYAAVAIMWIVPDRRIDRLIRETERPD
ncbi:MAG: DUF1211 domain-containing protein [Micromonosporaceae bacterium]|nr:DUF1211 domain-containing protein [Micromonosporaceae bacterium]